MSSIHVLKIFRNRLLVLQSMVFSPNDMVTERFLWRVLFGLQLLSPSSSALPTSKFSLQARFWPVSLGVSSSLLPFPMPVMSALSLFVASKFTRQISPAGCYINLFLSLTCYANFCWGWGQLIGIGVIRAMFTRDDQWAYRIPYAVQVSLINFLTLFIVHACFSGCGLLSFSRVSSSPPNLLGG